MNRLAIVLTGLALSLFAASPAAAVRSEFFGINQGAPLEGQDLNAMSGAGIRTDRFLLFWGSLEPSRGPSTGLKRTGASAPRLAWNPDGPGLVGKPGVGGRGPSRPPVFGVKAERAWRDFLKAAVARYGPGGTYWAGAYRRQFGGRGAAADPVLADLERAQSEGILRAAPIGRLAYARLLKISHDAIKSRDPKARVLLAGMPGGET